MGDIIKFSKTNKTQWPFDDPDLGEIKELVSRPPKGTVTRRKGMAEYYRRTNKEFIDTIKQNYTEHKKQRELFAERGTPEPLLRRRVQRGRAISVGPPKGKGNPTPYFTDDKIDSLTRAGESQIKKEFTEESRAKFKERNLKIKAQQRAARRAGTGIGPKLQEPEFHGTITNFQEWKDLREQVKKDLEF